MLAIIDAFTASTPLLTAEDIIARLGYSRGTGYRYIRALHDSGLLSRHDRAYTLGPRITELDYEIRQHDPILLASQAVMQGLRDRFDCDVLLVSFFNDRVLVTSHERGDEKTKTTYGRGRRMPLFRGAASKVILAALPHAKQKRLFASFPDEAASSSFTSDWSSVRQTLEVIRKEKISVSFGELDPGNVGVASPILHNGPYPQVSVCLVFSQRRYDIVDKGLIRNELLSAAAEIARRIEIISNSKSERLSSVTTAASE